jgi:hypothetical protein
MLCVLLIPGAVWHHPTNDATYRGFDPKLIYGSSKGDGRVDGIVHVSSTTLELTALPLSSPTANLVTTPLRKLLMSFDVMVRQDSQGSTPLRLSIWSPTARSGFFVVFSPGPLGAITGESVQNGSLGHTLLGGVTLRRQSLGSYQVGKVAHLDLSLNKDKGALVATVSSESGVHEARTTSGELPDFFNSVRVSATASATSSSGASTVLLQNYVVTLPHERLWADKADDNRAVSVLLALGGLGGLVMITGIVTRVRRCEIGAIALMSGWIQRLRTLITPRVALIAGVITAGYLIPNVLLFAVGGHPFDMANEKLYAYVAANSGVAQLYYLPNLVSFPAIWGGVPVSEAGFPYEPALAYVFAATGWIARLALTSAGFTPASLSLEYTIKAVNVACGLADGILIFLILKHCKVSERWSLIAAALFIFNPAVWFSMSVWGQTHVISLFFALAAIWLAELGLSFGAWTLLAAAALTRPQMLVFAFLLGLVFVRKFPPRVNINAISWTIITVFLFLLPFTLPTSPSLPVDVMANDLRIQEEGANQAALTTVSQDASSIWPLVTFVAKGASGLNRSHTSSQEFLVGKLSYLRVGQILTVAVLLILAGLILFKRRWTEAPGAYLPLVAIGMTAFLMFTTGLVATHFVLALPFLLLCRKWLDNVAYFFIAGAWTVTTFVPMYGDMGNVIAHLDYPLLKPSNNPVTQFFVNLYSWDRFITLGTVANILVLIWLTASLLLRRRVGEPCREPAAPG